MIFSYGAGTTLLPTLVCFLPAVISGGSGGARIFVIGDSISVYLLQFISLPHPS